MKTLFIFALLLLTLSVSSAQQMHQPPAAMTFSQNYLLLRNQSPKFLYSWNWSNGPKALNQRLKINGYHTFDTFNKDTLLWNWTTYSLNTFNLMPDSIECMWSPSHIHHNYEPFDAMAALWYPWLNTSDSSRNFKGFRNDKSGASLPFLAKNTSVGSLDSSFSGGQTRYAWRLNANTSITGLVPAFSKPWLGNEFVYRSGGVGETVDTPIVRYHQYNTERMYLSINLRRLGTDTLMNNDTLLVMRLPYRTYNNVTGYLSFDSVPDPMSTITTARGTYRGSMWNTAADLTTFVLRRNMLPRSTDSAADITLNVMFFADNTVKRTGMPNAYINPRFNIRWGGRPAGVIDSIGIDVQYMPKNGSLSVQWVKLETPNARDLFFGRYDTHIAHEINRSLDSLHKYNTVRGTHHRIRRFYGREEFLITEWQANRYYNIYLDTLLSSEYGIIHNNHIAHTTLLREQWNGSTFQIPSGTPAPYSRALLSAAPFHNEQTLGIAGRDGYVSMSVGGIQKKHNDYEAQFRALPYLMTDPDTTKRFKSSPSSIYSLPLPPMTDSFYRANIVRANGESSTYVYPSVLQAIEGFLYSNAYLTNSSYIFSSDPWWANIWASNALTYDYVDSDTTSPNHFRTLVWEWGHRPFTGEELRYTMWNSLILGTKGFHIWQGGSTDLLWNIVDSIKWHVKSDMSLAPTKQAVGTDSTKFDTVRITNNPNLILDDPDIGTDFIDSTGGRNDMFTALFRRFFKFPDSAYHNAMRMNKIYAGFRSMRHIIDQIFTQLRRCDTTLLNLQLESWYAKGLRDYDLGNVALLTQYIDTNRTKHRIAKMNGVRDSWDSSFYDITMFSHKAYDTDSVIFLGVQNRRTNSLIIDGTDTLWYSTKDFQDSVAIGKYDKYAQLGSRTISIPLKNTGSYYLCLLHNLFLQNYKREMR